MTNECCAFCLGEVAEIIMGQSPPGETVSEEPCGLPLLNGPTEFGSHHPLPVQFTRDARKRATRGDLLFCVRGSTTGRMNWADQEYAIGRGVAAIRHKHVSELQPFLRAVVEYYLPDLLAQATGSTFPNVSAEQLARIPYPQIPEPEQRAIARILGTLDDKIELNRRMNETLEAMARAIFKSWFVDFDPVRAKADGREPAGMDAETAALFPDSFEETELRMVPKGWKVGTVEELCLSIENGGTPKRMETEYWCDGTIPWFKTGELTDGPLIESEEAITELGLSNSSCKLWQTGTILIALYASPTVGRLGILEMPATANQACSALIVKPEYGNSFLFYALFFAREGLQNIAVGAAQQNVSQQVVRLHKVLIPDTKAASAFQQLVQRYYQLRVSNEKQSRLLAFIRDTLLPRLLSGRVRVNHVRKPIEEEMA